MIDSLSSNDDGQLFLVIIKGRTLLLLVLKLTAYIGSPAMVVIDKKMTWYKPNNVKAT